MSELNDFGFSTVSADEYAAQQITKVDTAKEVAGAATASMKPELEKIEPKIINNLWKEFPRNLEYPKPMLIHKIEAEKTKQIFKSQK